MKIENNKVVSIYQRIYVDGSLFEESEYEYLHGDYENICPGLAKALEGKEVGDEFSVAIKGDYEEGYGDYEDDDIEVFNIADIPGAEFVEVNSILTLEDEDGYEFECRVLEMTGTTIKLDFNPPLAGKDAIFIVEVLAIRDAEENEIEIGFPKENLEDMFGGN